MLKKLMILPIAAGFLAVNAGAAVTPTAEANMVKNSRGCYQIGSAEDLYGFAAVVNGTNGNTANKTACALVLAPITVNQNVLSADKKLMNPSGFESWTPMVGFQGVFDGGNNEISGLYYVNEAGVAGFISSASDGAIIRNVKIEDSYFRANNNAGGIVATVNKVGDAKQVLLDNCSFAGTITAGVKNGTRTTKAENIGGLVGSAAEGAQLVVSNSKFTGRLAAVSITSFGSNGVAVESAVVGVSDVSGLVGYNASTLKVLNSYAAGTIYIGTGTNDAVVGQDTKNSKGSTYANAVYYTSGSTKIGGASQQQNATIESLDEKLEAYDQAEVLSYYDAAAIEAMLAPDLSGINFKDTTWTEGNIFKRKTYAITSSTLDDTAPLILPQSVTTDSVVLDRTFEVGVNSTVMLPFGIKANKAEGAKFFNITALNETDGVWTVTGEQEVDSIKPHTPYLVKPTATRIIFRGKVTLVATNEAKYSVSIQNSAGWSFCGLYATKQWLEGDEELGKAGQVYGYSSKADADRGIENGSFVRAGKNVRVKTMRGYLYYAVPRVAGALAKAAAVSLDDLPSSMELKLVEKELPPYVEENAEIVESTTSIGKSIMVPATVKADRWYNLNGRRLNKKPDARGTYFNNNIPVVIK